MLKTGLIALSACISMNLSCADAISSQHPQVSASNDIIDIDVRGSTDYFGPLYVG